LKHAHQIFIKDTLPYLLKLIDGLSDENDPMVKDLKMVMPMFVEDFIHHIYEEEDRLFAFVYDLELLIANKVISSQIIDNINNFSVQEFALHHNSSDDEMSGIRGITNQYKIEGIEDVQMKVMINELMAFDKELTKHANIENDILFPKVLKLEKEAREMIKVKSSLN
jgi:regulator of cell morphogenesis and NO signaling